MTEFLPSKVKQFRENRSLTQAKLGKRVDVTGPTISSWEIGKTHPKQEEIVALAKVP